MTKPKRKPYYRSWAEQLKAEAKHPDTERLDALLRAMREWERITGMVFGLTTRRDIDKLLREEGRRGK